MASSLEMDCSNSKMESPVLGCDLLSQAMGAPPKLDAAPPQKIILQVEMTQPSAPPEPDHIKVHHNAFSVAVHSIGHFGKQYALGLKDSVEPRNLGRETLPVGIGVGTQVIVAHQLAMGIKGGFNQLGQGEAQLGAGQLRIAQQLGSMQQEITALQAAKSGAAVGSHLAKATVGVREVSVAAPHVASGVSVDSMVSLPVSGASPSFDASPAMAAGVASDTAGGAVLGRASSADAAASDIAQGAGKQFADNQTASDRSSTVASSNATLDAPNVGIDTKGFAVPMTPKQMEKATAYQDSVDQSESQLKLASDAFQAQLQAVSATMGYSPYAKAFVNDMQMRYKYAMTDDQNDDHKSARSFISDLKQDTDNLKRLAKTDNNPYAVIQLDALKQTVNRLDDIEKHFHKRPTVVLASNPEQASNI